MDVSVPHAVSDYFEVDARRDIDGIVALFTSDAVVLDEGQTWRGTSEIRDWQLGPASKYQYTTQVLGAEATGENTILVTARLTGNFPGGVADLKWLFTLDADLIQRLKITP